jgi:hypothetical protein
MGFLSMFVERKGGSFFAKTLSQHAHQLREHLKAPFHRLPETSTVKWLRLRASSFPSLHVPQLTLSLTHQKR